jgi:hypothetical protein
MGSVQRLLYIAYRDGSVAYDQNNYGALAGSALVAAGATAGFIGTLSAVELLGLSLSGWGTIAVVLGSIATAFLADSDLETFVSHCCFGKHYGNGDTKPKWASTPLKAWKGSYDSSTNSWSGKERFNEQLKSLFNLICAFSIQRKRNNRARIRYGFLTPRSLFRIRAQVIGTGGESRSFELAVSVAEKSITHEGGDSPDLSRDLRQFSSEGDADGNWFEVEFDISKAGLSESQRRAFDEPFARLQIQLDVFGDASFQHPSRFVPYDLRAIAGNDGGEGAPGTDNPSPAGGSEPVNSKDYL